ncbi:MAG: DUF4861 domain-containing protein [Tannerella sp.]|jgi:hypothetical protein|nr:DUF4861 domain-containing protein [Tannerella sp.]
MKKTILLTAIAVWFVASCSQEATFRITVDNSGDYDRTDEVVEIPLNVLQGKVLPENGQTFVVKNSDGEIVVSQLTYDGKLIFQAGVEAGKTAVYTVSAGEPPMFHPRTYGRFVTERKDDFAWENDRVAFRIYGPALIAVDCPSNGLDLWYKRTGDLIIDKWYRDDIAGIRSYHEDHGEGLDDYKVGRTLGGGMMAPYVGEKLRLNENFAKQELLENGPLRTTFILMYKDIEVDGKLFAESRTFSLDAGSQLTKVTQSYGTDEAIPVAAGIVTRKGEDAILKSKTKHGTATLIYAEPASKTVGKVYVGMVFPGGLNGTAIDSCTITHAITGKEESHSHLLGVTTYQPGAPITYYTGFGWSKYGFPSVEDFETYIGRFAENLDNPLIVKY